MSRIELGALVALAIAVVGGIFFLGKMEGRLSGLEAEKGNLAAQRKAMLEETDRALDSAGVPVGTIRAFDPVVRDDTGKSAGTYRPTPRGWRVCDGREGTPDLRGRLLHGVVKKADAGQLIGSATHHHAVAGRTSTEGTGPVVSNNKTDGHGATYSAPKSHWHDFSAKTDPASLAPPAYTVLFIIRVRSGAD